MGWLSILPAHINNPNSLSKHVWIAHKLLARCQVHIMPGGPVAPPSRPLLDPCLCWRVTAALTVVACIENSILPCWAGGRVTAWAIACTVAKHRLERARLCCTIGINVAVLQLQVNQQYIACQHQGRRERGVVCVCACVRACVCVRVVDVGVWVWVWVSACCGCGCVGVGVGVGVRLRTSLITNVCSAGR